MLVEIKNNIILKNPPTILIDEIFTRLIIKNPEYISRVKMGLYLGRTNENLYLFIQKENDFILPFGSIEWVYKFCKEHNIEITLKTCFNTPRKINLSEEVSLYPYQEKALEIMLKYKNGCLEAPCGSGKTRIGLALIKTLGLKALWLTHTKDLLNQSFKSASILFPSEVNTFGTITEGKVNIGSTITFATVQTLSKIETKFYRNEFDIVIVDEAHHLVGSYSALKMFFKVVSNINARYKFGLSATYERSDNLINTLFETLGSIKHKISKEEISSYRVKKTIIKKVDINLDYDIKDYISVDGTLDFNLLNNFLATKEERNDLIVDNIIKNSSHYQLVLSSRVAAIDELERKLKEKNINVIKVNGLVKKRDFTLKNDTKIILATFQLAREGLDIPKLDVLHLISPIKDEVALTQSVGRVQRKYKDKKEAMIYDYVDINIPYCLSAYKKRNRIYKKIII